MRILGQNKIIENERNNVLRANVNVKVTLMKTYLSQNRSEMALVTLNDIESNVELLDSGQINELFLVKEVLCDSILTSPMLLVNISDVEEWKPLDYTTLFNNSEVVDIQHDDDYGCDALFIHSKESNQTDTIWGEPGLNFITNRGLKHIATYEGGDDNYNKLDTVYTPRKAGIRVYSLLTGKIERFVSCYAWFPWMAFPMSISNDGKSLIYHEGQRAFERTWFINFDKGQRIPLNTSYSNSYDYAISSFSPNDNWFYLYYPEKKKIEIYTSKSLEEIHTFRYEDCDSVYWDSSNNVCISSRGKIYSWKILNNKINCTFTVGSFANGVNISKKYAAVACDNGSIYIWDVFLGKMIFEKEIMEAPEDVAFTKDEKQLWAISGYNCIKAIDLNSKSVKSIYRVDGFNCPPHPWKSYLYMTKDGEHCISLCNYGHEYLIFDIKGNIIETRSRYDDHLNDNPNDILSELVFPEELNYDPEQAGSQKKVLTARRISPDGKMCIEGYSNGIIKVFSLQDKNTIYSLIMGENTLISKNRMEYGRE